MPESWRVTKSWSDLCEGIVEPWRIKEWSETLTRKRDQTKRWSEYQFIGIDSGLEWARTSMHVAGCALTYVVERDEWVFQLNADACGELRDPVSHTDREANRAVAGACIMAWRQIYRSRPKEKRNAKD